MVSSSHANPPKASYIFPAGGRRGTTVNVRVGGLYLYDRCAFELLGPGVQAREQLRSIPRIWFEGPILPLPASQQAEDYPRDMAGEIRIGSDAPLGARHGRLWTAEGAAGGLHFIVGDWPEILEHEIDGDPIPVDVSLPVTINGRIFPREDVDDWTFTARKGQTITAEVYAARLGSPLDSRLEVYDPHGHKVADNDDTFRADSQVRFTAKEEGKYRLRILDANQQGGPAHVYRLTLAADLPPQPPATKASEAPYRLHLAADALSLPHGGQARLRITADRQGGYTGPIVLHIDGLPAGVATGKTVIAAGQTAADITFTTTAFASTGPSRLTIHGTATMDGKPVTQTATFPAMGDEPGVDSVLLVVGRKAPFKIVGDYDLRLAPRGSEFRRRYRIQRNGFTGPLQVSLADHQMRHLQGVTGPTLTIPPEVNEFEYPVRLPPWMETGRTSRACIMTVGVLREGGREYTVGYSSEGQNDQVIAVVETGRLGMEADRHSVAAVPGGQATVNVRIRRGKGLAGPVRLELIRPEHVQGLQAPTVVIPADQSAASFTLRFASGAMGPFNMPVVLRATLENASGPAIAETKLEIVPDK